MPDRELYIGLMSGTSADSIDAVLADLSDEQHRLLATFSCEIADLKHDIHELATPGPNEISRMGQLDRELGIRFANAVNTLLHSESIDSSQVIAIGSHGQTIRHLPPEHGDNIHPFTLQIGDPNTIAHLTGITTVADFRRRDIALGGQGAPLTPLFHRAAFEKAGIPRAIINIGGIANITLLYGDGVSTPQGYDTGPGNGLMDSWILRCLGKDYDNNGQWASQGRVIQPLLEQFFKTPYLLKKPPKSTGRELFNPDWLSQQLVSFGESTEPADLQATLLEFTAQTISASVRKSHRPIAEAYLCGGGAYNGALVSRISALLDPIQVSTTEALGILPGWVEAMAFAWLAQQTLAGKPGNEPTVTGALAATVLGAIHPA
ncbi:anhydro-N-acetylmuramic acid kinase [Porticoccus sp.]|uniref:anhydro-N-acetylmuramic acid kinase n=1 Tax=Porticoccus sp. TaxID=2024853 RepID=UPI000C58E5DA|nr:anhydro-N-acetylmuramic acid kinase [Porticoccus sp.]MAZ70237.1 anhydro-N-acetylmuramic acid kinase [Porticoccus sp.]|tara:strand:- start:59278 stop:60405 length:1128 start_codon:yes stop_codon:yes gene_type:complete